MLKEAVKAGARGYVVKSSISKDLLTALADVGQHKPFFDASIPEGANRSGHIDAQEVLQRSAALEQALRESEELYRSTFDLAAVGIAHVSPHGQWLRVNKKLCKIVGYSEEELLKMRFQDITHPDDLGTDVAGTEKVRTGASDTYSIEKRYIRKDGSLVWVNLTVSALHRLLGRNGLTPFCALHSLDLAFTCVNSDSTHLVLCHIDTKPFLFIQPLRE